MKIRWRSAWRSKRLSDFRRQLCQRTIRGRPISIKTVRNVIDWHFRALYREAREELEEQEIVLGDPFTRLRWQKTIREKPDPFTPEERDVILEYFRTKKAAWFPLVYALFFTGARPGELAALRIGDVDLERGTISITKSRDEHAEAAPKTEKSRREIPLLPNVVEVLWHGRASSGRGRRHLLLPQPGGRSGDDDVVAEEELAPGAQEARKSDAGSSTPRGTRSSRGRSRRA